MTVSCFRFFLLASILLSSCELKPKPEDAMDVRLRVVGNVEKVTIFPHGHANCPDPCAGYPKKWEDGEGELICISNSCGCVETVFAIQRRYMEQLGMRRAKISQTLGEWCRPPFGQPSSEVVYLGVATGDKWVSSVPVDYRRLEKGLKYSEAEYHSGLVLEALE